MVLHKGVYVFVALGDVWIFIMRHIVNFPAIEERLVDDPWRLWDDFVYPPTVSGSLQSRGDR